MEPKEKLLYFLKQPAFVVIAGYFYILSTMSFGFNSYDSGLLLTGGLRILNGELPYKDFFTLYAPGQFYLNAFIQLINSEVLFLRLLLSFFQLGILILVYKSTKILFGKNYYIYSVLLASFWLGAFDMWNRAIIVALFLNLLLAYKIVKAQINIEKNNYFLNAFYISLIIFFRHDVGGIALLCYILYIGLTVFKIKSFKEIIIILLKTIIGFIPLILFVIYFLSKVNIDIIYQHLITLPKNVFPLYRNLPFPHPFHFEGVVRFGKDVLLSSAFYLPVITLILSFIYLVRNNDDKRKMISYIIFIIPMLNQMIVRSELEHTLPAAVMSSVVIIYLLDKFLNNKKLLLLVFVMMLPNMLAYKYKKLNSVYPDIKLSNLENIQNVALSSVYDKNLTNAVYYIKSNTLQSEKIYVGLENHDKVFSNEAGFYFLSQRMPSTYYHELHPGITTTLKSQQKIYYSLEIHRVNYLVLFDSFEIEEENLSNKSSNVFYLDKKIKDYFNLDTTFGNIKIHKRIFDED